MEPELTFDYIPKEERQKYRELLDYIQKLELTYREERTLDFKDIVKEQNIAIESVLALIYYFVSYLQQHGRGEGIMYIKNYVLSPPDTYNALREADVAAILQGTEGFIKGIGYVLYQNVEGIQELIEHSTLSPLINGRVNRERGSIPLPEFAVGKSGFVNLEDDNFKELAQMVLSYRNANSHGNTEDEKNKPYLNKKNKKKVEILEDVIGLLILLIHYRYEEIAQVVCADVKSPLPPVDEAQVAEEAVRDVYLPALQRQQTGVIRRVYPGMEYASENELPPVIHVRLKKYEPHEQTADEEEEGMGSQEEEMLDALSIIVGDNAAENRWVFLGGASGTGKSTMLAQMILQVIDQWKEKDSNEGKKCPLPIRINMADYVDPKKSFLAFATEVLLKGQNVLYSEVQERALKNQLNVWLKEGRGSFFIDGLNEIPNNAKGVLEKILEFVKEFSDCQFILTSRIVEIQSLFGLLEGFKKYELCPLAENQIKEQVKNFSYARYHDKGRGTELLERISDQENLKKLSQNPMQLMLLIGLLENDRQQDFSMLNRSTLYDLFIKGLMVQEIQKHMGAKSSLNEENEGYESRRRNLDRLLCFVASMMLQDSQRILSIRKLQDSLMAANVFGGNWNFIYERLADAKKLGLVSETGGFLSFTHDSWMEFYQALDVVCRFVELNTNTKGDKISTEELQKLQEEERLLLQVYGEGLEETELLRTTFELMEQRGILPEVQCELTMMLLRKGWKHAGQKLDATLVCPSDASEGALALEGQAFPAPNSFLEKLAAATSSIRYVEPDPKNRGQARTQYFRLQPRFLVETFILNQLYLYKRFYPRGEVNMEVLQPLFRCASLSGSRKVLDELCQPYWLRIWLLRNEDFGQLVTLTEEERKGEWTKLPCEKRPAKPGEMKLLSMCLLLKTTNPFYLFDCLYNLHVIASGMRLRFTWGAIQYDTLLLLLQKKMDDKTRKKLVEHMDQLEKSNIRSLYRGYALLAMKDVKYMKASLSVDKVKGLYHPLIIDKLLKQLDADSWITQVLVQLLRQMNQRDSVLRVIRYMLFHNIYNEPLVDFLWNRDHRQLFDNSEIVDLLPLRYIPDEYVQKHYDLDIYRYQKDQSPEEDDAVEYFVYDYAEERLALATLNVKFEFAGCFFRLKTSQDEWAGGQFLREEEVSAYQYTVRIVCVAEQQLMPLRGCIRGADEAGQELVIHYIAALSNADGLLLLLYHAESVRQLKEWKRRKAEVWIDNMACRVSKITRSALPFRLKVLHLSVPVANPRFRGVFWVYQDSDYKKLLRVNKAVKTLYNQRPELFRPVVRDQKDENGVLRRQAVNYVLYSMPSTQTLVLGMEKVTTNLNGCYCRLDNFDQWFLVDDNASFPEAFVEISLSGVASHIPVKGMIRLNVNVSDEGDNDWDVIPYIYCIRRGQNYVMRVEHPLWVAKLQEPEVVALLQENDSVSVRQQHLRFVAVNVYSHAASSSRLSIHAVDDTPQGKQPIAYQASVPEEGKISFYRFKKEMPQNRMLLAVSGVSRAWESNLKQLVYIGHYEKGAAFVCKNHQPIEAGTYVHLANESCTHVVCETNLLSQIWRIQLHSEQELPAYGWIKLNILNGLCFRYWKESRQGMMETLVVLFVGKKMADLMVEQILPLTEAVEIAEVSYMVEQVRPLCNLSEDFGLFLMLADYTPDFPLGTKIEWGRLEYYQPINNHTEASIFEVIPGQLYEADSVNYLFDEYNNTGILAIPQPATSIKSLYFSLNDKQGCYRIERGELPENMMRELSDLPLFPLQLPPMINFNAKTEREGVIHFYYDSHGRIPAKVGYNNLSSLIELNMPEKYHTSVCNLLLEECKELNNRGNRVIYDFFKQRSCAAEYLKYYLSMPEKWQQSHDKFYPDVCIVLSVKPVGTVLFSPQKAGIGKQRVTQKDFQKGLVNSEYDIEMKAGDLVVYELNHRLEHIPMQKRLPILGFLQGVVVRVTEQDAFIHSDCMEEDFYSPVKPHQVKLEEGDLVSFFPSMNLAIRSQYSPLAAYVQKLRSIRRPGTVTGIRQLGTGKILVHTKDTELDVEGQTFFNFSHDSSGRVSTYCEQLKVGDTVCYYFYVGYDKGTSDQTLSIVIP